MNEPGRTDNAALISDPPNAGGILRQFRRDTRIAIVTFALAITGATFGAGASAIACGIWLWSRSEHVDGFAIGFAAAFGGVCGAILGPAGAWLLLRKVPLGVAVLGTTIGAIVGGSSGGIAGVDPVASAVIGFLTAGIGLRWRYRQRHHPTRV